MYNIINGISHPLNNVIESYFIYKEIHVYIHTYFIINLLTSIFYHHCLCFN